MNTTQQQSVTAPITPRTIQAEVMDLKKLSPAGYELIIERKNLQFQPGQLVNLHGRHHMEDRSYSICSGILDPTLSILFRHIPSGVLTPQLVNMKPGDTITFSGPYGEFVIRDRNRPLYFFATGTGLAPCRSYLRSYSGLDLTLIHGVRDPKDLYYREEFASIDYQPCVSSTVVTGDAKAFAGRVTDWAIKHELPLEAHYYLCGANEMIYEMQELLTKRGIGQESIFTEAYYYRSNDA
ncbi:MAG TPA: FAD-dependent oxidoreductase [Kiritimatiellia bacterium]|nr:FAD-dependent oxidoreductase [Kiritimatiellia bacterium]